MIRVLDGIIMGSEVHNMELDKLPQNSSTLGVERSAASIIQA